MFKFLKGMFSDDDTPQNVIDYTFGAPERGPILEALTQLNFSKASTLFGLLNPPLRSLIVKDLAQNMSHVKELGQWIQNEPDHPIANLLGGATDVVLAWEARSYGRGNDLSETQVNNFHAYLDSAHDKLMIPLKSHEDADGFAWMITVLKGMSAEKEVVWSYFDAMREVDPENYLGHEHMLNYSLEKWLGSHDEMWEFMEKFGSNAPSGSVLGGLVTYAVTEFWLYRNSFDEEPEAAMEFFKQPKTEKLLLDSYHKTLGNPDFLGHPFENYLRNYFAFCLAQTTQYSLALSELQKIGKNVSRYPWFLYADNYATAIKKEIRYMKQMAK